MQSVSLFSLIAVMFANVHAGKVHPPTPTGMMYLGSFKVAADSTDPPFVETDYFVDFQSRNWVEAKEQCKGLFEGGSLIAINSEEELENIKEMLEQHGSGRSYFIGATLDNGWKWSGNKKPFEAIGEFITNNAQLPNRPINSMDTILLQKNRLGQTVFPVVSKSDTNPFICEVDRSSCT